MKRAAFGHRGLSILLLVPQIAIIGVFFYWPALHALTSSFYLQDPFGFSETFVGLSNYTSLFKSAPYSRAATFKVVFTLLVTFLSLAIALLLAVKAGKVLRGAKTYRTLLMWVYAVAPPVAGVMRIILFNQSWGPLTNFFQSLGWDFKLGVNY